MAEGINRQHIYNIMDWIEEEQDKRNDKKQQDRISKLAEEIAILRRDNEYKKEIAISELYGAVVRTGYDYPPYQKLKVIHIAMAMTYLCGKLSIIDYKEERNLIDRLDRRLQEYHKNEKEKEQNEHKENL